MNFIQRIWFYLGVITFARLILYLLAFSIAGIAIKCKSESKVVDQVLKVLIFVSLYPRHTKYFEVGGKS